MSKKTVKNGNAACINIILLGIMAFITLFPFYYVIVISIADSAVMARTAVYLLPLSFDLSAYKLLFSTGAVISGFAVSLSVVVLGTAFCMFMTVSAAYALSKKTLPFRNIILGAIVFTLFFGGQLIPYYLTIKALGLVNNLLVMVIPAGINTFYLIIIKSYFQTIPDSIEESAKIDGANDIYLLVKIIVPISMPIMATFILFYAVERWNDWWFPLLFISKPDLRPLQTVLREAISSLDNIASSIGKTRALRNKVSVQAVRMAIVVITTLPVLLVYPFMQKYYTNGIMIGSIKG